LKFGEMEFGEMKRNTSNWSNFCMLLPSFTSRGFDSVSWAFLFIETRYTSGSVSKHYSTTQSGVSWALFSVTITTQMLLPWQSSVHPTSIL